MNPPIPPPVPTPETEPPPRMAKPRPRGLGTVVVIEILLVLTSYLFIAPAGGSASISLGPMTVMNALSLVILWFLWNGHNWARIVTLTFSAVGLFNIFLIGGDNNLRKIVAIASFLFSVFTLFWLNTRPVRDYFKRA